MERGSSGEWRRAEPEDGRREGDQNNWGEILNPFYPFAFRTGGIRGPNKDKQRCRWETGGLSRERCRAVFLIGGREVRADHRFSCGRNENENGRWSGQPAVPDILVCNRVDSDPIPRPVVCPRPMTAGELPSLLASLDGPYDKACSIHICPVAKCRCCILRNNPERPFTMSTKFDPPLVLPILLARDYAVPDRPSRPYPHCSVTH